VEPRRRPVLNYGEAVEIVFQGTNVIKGSMNHLTHLHGYSFYVVGKGLIFFDNETDPKGLNLVDPLEVNTFGVPKKGWLAIRFVANNPGIFYCFYFSFA
jgi:laccase